jgi:hypothetical protein
MAKLPDSEELTEHAVEAEEMLETLKADAELVGNLEMGMEQSMASEEELAILKEFEAARAPAQPAEAARPERPAAKPAERDRRVAEAQPESQFEPRSPEPPRKERGKTGPEPG